MADLKAALGLRPSELVAIVGAGGKTATASRLGSQVLVLAAAHGERGDTEQSAHSPYVASPVRVVEYALVIPAVADRVVIIAGLDAIDKPLDEHTVHRPEIAARLLCIPLGTVITPDPFANLIGHTSCGLKGIPSNAKAVALLT